MSLDSPDLWSRLSIDDLARSVFEILHREGFHEILRWETGDAQRAESGRVIAGRRTEFFDQARLHDWVVQCWPAEDSVEELGKTLSVLHEKLLHDHPAEGSRFRLAVATGLDLGEDGRKALEAEAGCNLVFWDRPVLQRLYDRHQDLRLRIFGVAPTPQLYFQHLSDRERRFINFETLLAEPVIAQSFETASRIAVDQSTLLTIAHLLVALLRLDEKHSRLFITELGLIPSDIASYLEELLAKGGNRVDFKMTGLRPSQSFRSVLDTAVIVMKVLDEERITERVLLLAILIHPESDSVAALHQLCGQEKDAVLDSFLNSQFAKMESKLLMRIFGPNLKTLGTEGVRALWDEFAPEEDSVARTRIMVLPGSH